MTRYRSGEKWLGLGYMKRELTRFAEGLDVWGEEMTSQGRLEEDRQIDTHSYVSWKGRGWRMSYAPEYCRSLSRLQTRRRETRGCL